LWDWCLAQSRSIHLKTRVLRPSNKWQLFLMGDNGDLPEAARICKLLIILVAGAYSTPKLPDLPFRYILPVSRGYNAHFQ
jgi:hypothetical protein